MLGPVQQLYCGVRCALQAQFVEKNNDALHSSLAGLVTESKNPLVKTIFLGTEAQNTGKLAFISIGSKFRSQLGTLMEKLNSTVRCHWLNLRFS